LAKNGQVLLPMVELIEQSKIAVDELIDVLGRAQIAKCSVCSGETSTSKALQSGFSVAVWKVKSIPLKPRRRRAPYRLIPTRLRRLSRIARGRRGARDTDFIFAGPTGKPRWPGGLLTDHLKPAAAKAGIGNIGWHTFRHTYSTLLHALGTTPAVQKELLRHADIQTTLNVYTQAISAEKREAASKVADVLWRT